ncbi:MAG: TSUP family transporter [Planctomycetota bacterium]
MSPPTRPWFRSPLLLAGLVAGLVWGLWLALLGPRDAMAAVVGEWPVAVTMIFGSFIAGASSEGGGAVAFPVFTKALGVAPADARRFALMIQSVGMTAAAVTVFALRVRVDFRAIGIASAGGAIGVAVGLLAVAPSVEPAQVRVVFTALQAAFAVVLLIAGARFEGRAARSRLIDWRGVGALAAAGLLGGVVSGVVGSGLDLVLFAVLTLLFRVSEKVATPTSVVVMAINSVVAVALYAATNGPAPANVTAMWLAAVPVVVVGAPLGAWVCSRLRRETIARALVALIAIEVATTLWLVPPTPVLVATGIGVFLPCLAACLLMASGQAFDPVRLRSERLAS